MHQIERKKSQIEIRDHFEQLHTCAIVDIAVSQTQAGNDEIFVIVRGKGKVFPWMSNVNMSKSIGSRFAVYSR